VSIILYISSGLGPNDLLSTTAQLFLLALAVLLGASGTSIFWLLPLTVVLGIVGWLTDRYWKVRFYDIYNLRGWTKFWLETLLALVCLTAGAFVLGRVLREVARLAA